MDYYYALLNSYELLKQRRFKLSLREEGDKQGQFGGARAWEDESSEEENVQKLISAAGNAANRDVAVLYTGTNISLYKATTGSIMAGDKDDVRGDGQVQWAAIVDKEGKRGKSPTANKYWGIIFGGKEEDTTQPQGKITDTKDRSGSQQMELPFPEIEAIGITLGDISSNEEGLKVGENENGEPLTAEEEDERLREREETKQQEVNRLITLSETTLSLTEFNEETLAQTLQSVNDFLQLGLRMAKDPVGVNNRKYTDEINTFIDNNKVTIDQYGCLKFNEIGVGICGDDAGEVTTRLQNWVPLIQGAQQSDKKEMGVGSEARVIPQVDVDYDVANTAARGVAVEDLDQLSNALGECLGAEDSKAREGCLKEFNRKSLGSWERFEVWKEEENRLEENVENIKNNPELSYKEKNKQLKKANAILKRHRKNQKGTDIDALTRSLAVGVLAEDSAILTGKEETRAYYRMRFIEDRLIAEGANPKAAKQFVREAAGIGKDGKYDRANVDRMKVLLATILSNRHFAKAIRGDVTPTATIGAGQGQSEELSNELGAKKDVVDVYCENDPQYAKMKYEGDLKTNIRENIKENLLSKEQKDHYSKKCGEGQEDTDRLNDFIDNDLIRDVDPAKLVPPVECKGGGKAYTVNREPKTHIDLKQPSTMGEMGPEKQKAVFDFMCKNTEDRSKYKHRTAGSDSKDATNTDNLSKRETEHLEKTENHIAECGSKGKKAAREEKKGACNFHKLLVEKTSGYLPTLQPGAWVQELDGTAMDVIAGEEMLKKWFDRKKGTKTAQVGGDMYNRKQAAVRCLQGTGSDEDCKELIKVRRDIETAEFGVTIHKKENLNTDGSLQGDARSYAMFMYSTIAGANGEVLNEKRGLADNQQKAGLRNAEVRANEAQAKFIPGKGSIIYVVVDGEQRAKLERESGVVKVKTGKSDTLYKTISDTEPAAETRAANVEKKIKAEAAKKRADKKAVDAAAEAKADPNNKKLAAKAATAKKRAAKFGEKEEDIVMAFLRGQQDLLEKLINQTT